ncbi:MAG: HypC/HybG/HupF family hydrogenase formation chaperone [Eggerthellaceae bacterium]
MCLAIPAQIVRIKEDNIVEVSVLGVMRDASIDLTPDAKVGDYVLIHAGFAIEIVDPDYAEETLDLVRQMPELLELGQGA